MFSYIFIIIISSLCLICSCTTKKEEVQKKAEKAPVAELIKQANSIFGKIPEKMPGSENDTPELIELGKKLYFDKRLSVNDTISCNSCHNIENKKAGVDNLPTSPGAHGKRGNRNSPTVLNAGFHIAQFWDGRAATLEEQAKMPIINPVEMAMPSEEEGKEVVKKVSSIDDYNELFKKAFPNEPEPLTFDNIAKAIAAFERTLITKDLFDDFLSGKKDALTEEEIEGLELFIKNGCTACHNGPLLGGRMFQKIGTVHPYENKEDLGRFNVTGIESDKYVFKVPSLRNVVLTYPYFHDGRVPTIEEAVKKMAWLQFGKELTEEEVNKIVKFLNTLSDKSRVSSQ
ncbi:MAG: cytochrome-c peroxidase [Nitrospirae bacterium]|nr:MAG: cytochrome-c peroxidase [Nitrospirota bacterium]